MNVLGLNLARYHPAACLIVDGTLVAMAEEERFNRIKVAEDCVPRQAAAFCLRRGGLASGEVDRVAIGWNGGKYATHMPAFMLANWLRYGRTDGGTGERRHRALGYLLRFRSVELTSRALEALGRSGAAPGGDGVVISQVDHHLAHAAAAYYSSGCDEAAVLTVDGSGEDICTAVWDGRGRRLKMKSRWRLPHSLGWFYSGLTEYLGFRPNTEEGKLMGLAPYGRPDPTLRRQLRNVLADEPPYRLDPTYLYYGRHGYGRVYSDRLVEMLGPARSPDEPLAQRHRDIAFAVQDALERVVLHIARTAVRQLGVSDLCLGGGVALNCKLNGRLRAALRPVRVHASPVCHDAGTALGAAMIAAFDAGDDPRFLMTHACWGPDFADSEVKACLRRSGLPWRRLGHALYDTVADRIARGQVVGWFQGRMEVGCRALGNRSILADPRRSDMPDVVNCRVKKREPWRPFAPSILQEKADEYVADPRPCPFMTSSFTVRPDRRGDLQAVTHVDGSSRAQTVDRSANPSYWRLIRRFEELTGVPAVLNTSFNVQGEPIVCSPQDAVRTFVSSGLDCLAMSDFFVTKTHTRGTRPQQDGARD